MYLLHVTVADAPSVVLAAVLGVAAVLKLVRPTENMRALGTFGIQRPPVQAAALGAVALLEGALAVGVLLGSALAAWLAAGLMFAFAALLMRALRAGRRGEPCACFGARSRVSPLAVVRDVALGAALVALPFLPHTELATDTWLAIGLAVALLACVALGVAVLALAREVGTLRLALPAQAALEIEHEGPELGGRAAIIERFRPGPSARFALAVFSSDGCPLCRTLEPSVDALGRDPLVALETFDEVRDADAWEALHVPGSPYAVVLGLDGVVLAKGTFNSYAQLEGVLAAAERRQVAGARA